MPELSEYVRGKFIKALIYGKFKTGKTAGAATFPRANFIDFDSGIAVLTNLELERKYGYSKKGILYEQFKEKATDKYGLVKAHNAFDDACRYFDQCMMPTGGMWKDKPVGVDMFDTWVIDSGTTLSQFAKNKALILMGTSGRFVSGRKMSNTWDNAQQTGLILPKKQDFGAERSMVEQFVDMIKATDKHVLLLCHEREEWEGEGEAQHVKGYVPMFTGQSTETIPLKFDEVYNLQLKPKGDLDIRVLQTVATATRACGSRLGLPNDTPFEFDAIKKGLNL